MFAAFIKVTFLLDVKKRGCMKTGLILFCQKEITLKMIYLIYLYDLQLKKNMLAMEFYRLHQYLLFTFIFITAVWRVTFVNQLHPHLY
jgi:hypothetical protein